MNNIFYNINCILNNKYKEKNKEYSNLDDYFFNLHNFKSFHLVNNVEPVINFLKDKNINYHMFDNQNYNDDNIIKLSENKSVLFISYDVIKECIKVQNRKKILFCDSSFWDCDFGTKIAYLKMALFQQVDIVVYEYSGNTKDFLFDINNEIENSIKNSNIEMEELYDLEFSKHKHDEKISFFTPSSNYSLIGQNITDLLLVKEYLNSYDNYFNY